MEGGPLLSDWWVKESKRFVPYLNISARLDDKPDQQMMSEYDLRGFPSFIFLDTSGGLLYGKEPYWRPDSLMALEMGLEEVESIFQLRKHVAENPDDQVARARLTLIEGFLNPARANVAAMDVAASVKGVPAELVAEWKASRLAIRFLVVFEPYRIAYQEDAADRDQKRAEVVNFCYEGVKAGETMDVDQEWFRPFWILAFDGAREAEDEKIARTCFAAYEDAYGVQDRYWKKMKEQLEELVENKVGTAG